MTSVSFSVKITGKVQGVWYRQSMLDKAHELGVSGWVKNMDDKSVYAEVSGEELAVQAFLTFCRRGPERAVVDQVQVMPLETIHRDGFSIVR
jgi:acylphosphatase